MKFSRRAFLADILTLPAASVVLRGKSGRILKLFNPDLKRFSKPEIIHYDSECFTIRGVDTFLFSLEVPYARIPKELWRDRFLKIRRAGFNAVDAYLFWSYHEREPDHFDFTDLEEFLNLAQESGLWVSVRPGPYVDAEFERGGFPYWVIARRFPVRSMHPESLKSSKHWYDHVLPVIRRYQVTQGGPIILMQIENELDFTTLSQIEQREYIRFLARTAWDAGIEVPLTTNVNTVVRDRTDPDMARIMDCCDFYPRWSFLVDRELQELGPGATLEEKVAQSDRAVLATIRRQRREQPDCPLAIAELGTGYYSKFGGKLSEDEEGVEPAQTNAITKTLLGQGAAYLNYYLGCGGTNFEWAAKGVTTSYDFAAPIREWGGLSDKYYVIRGIGNFLGMFGKTLTRSQLLEKACHCTNPDMTVTERISGESGFVFLRGDTEAEHHFKLTFRDPASSENFTVPLQGELELGSRGMKILPVQFAISGGHLRYSTAELLTQGTSGDRTFLVIYDDPGNLVEVSLAAEKEPEVVGELLYRAWDKERRSAVLGMRMGDKRTFLIVDNRLQIVALPRELALRTWIAEFPSGSIPGTAASGSINVPFITDAYLLASNGPAKRGIWAELDMLPGDHAVTVVVPSQPAKCRVSGEDMKFHYDRQWRTVEVTLPVPGLPCSPVEIKAVQASVESLNTKMGNWIASPSRVLEEIGAIPYGYVKYRAQIAFKNEPKMYISAFSDDAKKVFVNGKLVPEASKAETFVEISTAPYLTPGLNTLEISYELFGSTEFGTEAQMAELKGVDSVRLGTDPETPPCVESWQIQTFPAAMRGREVDPNFSFGGWNRVSLGGTPASQELAPSFTWCRAEFVVGKADKLWSIPWRLVFEADRDALIYLNGKFVGRSVTVGPQTEFYLPEPFLHLDGQTNVLTILLAYTESAQVIRTLRVEPCEEHCARRTRIELEW